MLERFATGASTYAPSIDHLIFLIAVLVGFWLIVAEVALVLADGQISPQGRPCAAVRYRRRKALNKVGHDSSLSGDCLRPGDYRSGNSGVGECKANLPPAQETVRIFSQQWAWSFQQPGPDGILDTADDIRTVGELHVKANTRLSLRAAVARRAAQLLRPGVPVEAGCGAGPNDHRMVQSDAHRYIRHTVHTDVRHGPWADGWPDYR